MYMSGRDKTCTGFGSVLLVDKVCNVAPVDCPCRPCKHTKHNASCYVKYGKNTLFQHAAMWVLPSPVDQVALLQQCHIHQLQAMHCTKQGVTDLNRAKHCHYQRRATALSLTAMVYGFELTKAHQES